MTEQSIIKDNAYLFGFLEDAKTDFPDADPVKLERAAVCDGMSDITSRLEQLHGFIESIAWFVNANVEECGAGAPDELVHLSYSMDHAVDDCAQLVRDAHSVLGVAGQLVREPRIS